MFYLILWAMFYLIGDVLSYLIDDVLSYLILWTMFCLKTKIEMPFSNSTGVPYVTQLGDIKVMLWETS